jgi:hypothetical protein
MADDDPARLTPSQMREDLQVLRNEWASRDRSFSDEERREMTGIVDRLDRDADRLSVTDFTLEIMRAAAVSGNGHTAARVGRSLGSLPVRFWWFADGLYIIKTDSEFAELLGARVERIGPLSAEEALAKASPYISGTLQRVRYLSAAFLSYPGLLTRIGAAAGDGSVELTLMTADGRRQTAALRATRDGDPADEYRPTTRAYTALIPDDPKLPNRWPHVLDNAVKRSPIFSKRVDVSASWIGELVLYVRSNSVSSSDEQSLVNKFARIVHEEILEKRPRHVVVDLRLNNGGDSFNTILFSQALPKLVPPGGKVFVLVGRATFSAALVTASMLKGHSQDNVMLIGETMGDDGQFWAEGDTVELPNSRIQLDYADQYEDYENGCADLDRCYWATVAFGPKGISLQPDQKVELTFAEYAAGSDPVLARALELADE